MLDKIINTVWDIMGEDKSYEYYRKSKSTTYKKLREWVDSVYIDNGLRKFLDKNFLRELRDGDFYARLWELEVLGWLIETGLNIIPTDGKGPDFCIKLDNGLKIWVEAVLPRPDDDLKKTKLEALKSNGREYNTPKQQTGLRYTSSLGKKAKKIKTKYGSIINKNDYIFIAISAFSPDAMPSDIDMFMDAVLPIDHRIYYFSNDSKGNDSNIPKPTHTIKKEYINKNGISVPKDFLYPGKFNTHIDGILFSEASNLQQLLGVSCLDFSTSTNTPHIFQRYGSRELPTDFTDIFYLHKIKINELIINLEKIAPIV